MPFERYLGQRKRASMDPKAAIWKTGQISLNRAFLERYGISGMNFAILLYDRDKNRIAVKFVKDGKEPGTAKLIKKADGAAIFAQGFLKHFGIGFDKARRFDVRRDDKEDLFILEPES